MATRSELYRDFDKTLGRIQVYANAFSYRELRDVLNYAETQDDSDRAERTIRAFCTHPDGRAALERYIHRRRSEFARSSRAFLEFSAHQMRKQSKSR